MKSLLFAVSAIALGAASAPSWAQHQHMPGMTMPAPAKPAAKPVAKKKKPAAKRPAAKKASPAATRSAKRAVTKPVPKRARPAVKAPAPLPDPRATDHSTMDHSAMGHGTPAPAPAPSAQPMPGMDIGTAPTDHSGHAPAPGQSAGAMPGMDMSGEHGGHAMAMTGALGPYSISRESSGTAWQPDASEHGGTHSTAGDWSIMTHGVLNLVVDHQGGPRGDDKAFVSGMLMGMARRPLGNGTLQFKGMVSPDPLMGKSGYPLLLASGETANGTERLIDRQHPHDFFMELSASLSQNIGNRGSAFIYAGLPGEPAFGPPAFMHRESILESPEAPISHHWLDSTHISFGVITAGLVLGDAKLEVSRFNGREPDEHRWNIETGPLDSTAVRLSWNPARPLSLQGSWGHFEEPEQLEPGVDQTRLSASAMWADEIAPGWKAATTLAWGRKIIDHDGERLRDDAFAAEASLKHRGWTIFGRGEIAENRELTLDDHGPAYQVGKVSLGAVRDFSVAEPLTLGVGALASLNFVPRALESAYGSRNPAGAMAFVRLKLK